MNTAHCPYPANRRRISGRRHPQKFFEGREATTRNESAVRRLTARGAKDFKYESNVPLIHGISSLAYLSCSVGP